MMRRAVLKGWCLFTPALAPAHDKNKAMNTQKVWIRIRNKSDETFDHVWQGHPRQGTDMDFGRVEPGQTSRWHAFPAVLPHYRKTRIQLRDRQLTNATDTALPSGRSALDPGYYTFVYTLENGLLRLQVIEEGGARPAD